MKKSVTILFSLAIAFQVLAQSTTYNISYGGVVRNFAVHLPNNSSAGQNLPVVFNFHGFGMTAYLEEIYSQMNPVADANNFIVVYPTGLSNGAGNAWNVGWFGNYDSGVDDVGFVSKIIDTLSVMYSINPNRVYACGLSNGGFLSHRLGCELGNRIAAIASVAGAFSDSVAYYCNPSRKIPVMIIHGTEDPTVPYSGLGGIGTEESISIWLNKNQCSLVNDTIDIPDTNTTDSATAQRINYRSCDDSTEVLFYKVINGGHTWPGSGLNVPYGPTCRDFAASTEIWNFFNRYSLAGPLGMKDSKQTQLEAKVYPNPFTDELKLDAEMEITKAELLNTIGQTVMKAENLSGIYSLNVSQLNPGIYFLKMESRDGLLSKIVYKNQ